MASLSVRYLNRLRVKHQVDRLYAGLVHHTLLLFDPSATTRLPSTAFRLCLPSVSSVGSGTLFFRFLPNLSSVFSPVSLLLKSGFLLFSKEIFSVSPQPLLFSLKLLLRSLSFSTFCYANLISTIKKSKKKEE